MSFQLWGDLCTAGSGEVKGCFSTNFCWELVRVDEYRRHAAAGTGVVEELDLTINRTTELPSGTRIYIWEASAL